MSFDFEAPAPAHLFVYGTLMRGSRSPYAQLLRARARFTGKASAQGRLYRLGRFPGAVFDEACAAKVHGEIFQLPGPALLAILDAYEECRPEDPEPHLFRREVVEARLSRGGALVAWSYCFVGGTQGRPRIFSGRFPLR